MRLTTGILLAILAASACTHQPAKKQIEKAEQKAEVKRVIPPPEEAASYQLSTTESRQWLEDYRFGKFFQERAEFFVIQDTKSKIFETRISTIIMYYLDGVHCQSRFILTENVADKLIAQYGTFTITPLDENNKRVLTEASVMINENGKKRINPELTHYELLWKLPSKYIRLHVDKDNPYEPYVYSEHVPDYHRLFRELELATL